MYADGGIAVLVPMATNSSAAQSGGDTNVIYAHVYCCFIENPDLTSEERAIEYIPGPDSPHPARIMFGPRPVNARKSLP